MGNQGPRRKRRSAVLAGLTSLRVMLLTETWAWKKFAQRVFHQAYGSLARALPGGHYNQDLLELTAYRSVRSDVASLNITKC